MGGKGLYWAVVGMLSVSLVRPLTSQSTRVESYSFDITIPDTGRSIRGIAEIHARSVSGSVEFALVGMSVDSVTTRGPISIPFSYDGQVLRIRGPLGDWIRIFYHGVP